MSASPPPTRLDYAGSATPTRGGEPVIAAFGCGLLFLALVILLRGGLHGEVNPIVLLAWLVLGIVTTGFLAAGWEGRRGPRGRLGRASLVVIAFGWLLGCLAVFGPAHDPHASDIRRQNVCASHLEQIGQAILLYTNNNGGRYPDRLDALLSIDDAVPDVLVCPSTDDVPATGPTTRDVADAIASGGHLSYVYVGKGLTSRTATATHVVAFEPSHNHVRERPGMNVLYGDGHVDYVESPASIDLAARVRGGENPPSKAR